MSRQIDNNRPPSSEVAIIIAAFITIGFIAALSSIGESSSLLVSVNASEATPLSSSIETIPVGTPDVVNGGTVIGGTEVPAFDQESKPTATPTPSPTPTVPTSTPTQTSTPTVTPTPTLDLTSCNAAGCGAEATVLPTAEYTFDLFLREETPVRRKCEECPPNEQLSNAELDGLIAADAETLERLRSIALSQETYEIAPGIVYIVYHDVHHVVVDLDAPGYTLRNVIPNTDERGTLITPSYCLSPKSLVVIDADYHGLNGSNKTETGRDLFFHLGRSALFRRDGKFDIDVIRERADYDRTTLSWGGGPIFMWDGEYDFDPEQEWFDPTSLEYYRETRWAKISAAISEDRKYLFLTASYGLTLEEHAENIISLGQTWGITVDRAMRFDGGESAYMAVRLDDVLVPILDLEEGLIVNCLAIERNN
jgi:hypothetical protein